MPTFFNLSMSNRTLPILTPSFLVKAYAAGIFPMALSADAHELHWFDPPVRALMPLDQRFHVPSRLRRTLRQHPYRISLNEDFRAVMQGCAEPRKGRGKTWINAEILRVYTDLHFHGNAHSLEVWEESALVGGLYGVAIGGAFFGESMFSRKTDASKIALVHLVGLLRHYGYRILDAQFQTNHLERFGTYEVVRSIYLSMLEDALKLESKPFPICPDWNRILAEVLPVQNPKR